MGEKTTASDEDSYEHDCNSGAPSPVVEENESPEAKKMRRINTQNSPRKDHLPNGLPGQSRKSVAHVGTQPVRK